MFGYRHSLCFSLVRRGQRLDHSSYSTVLPESEALYASPHGCRGYQQFRTPDSSMVLFETRRRRRALHMLVHDVSLPWRVSIEERRSIKGHLMV